LFQAIKRNIQSKGLQAFYNHNAKFQYYVKLLYGLAFVPPDFVEEAFENVVQVYLETHKMDEGSEHFPEELEDLNSYFERTYIGAIGGRQRTRRQPIYTVSTWSKFQDILDDVEITNNRMEGFNSGWASSMSRNPSLYTVLEGFLLKETGAKTTIDEDVIGVGGNGMQANCSRHLQAVQRRLDLKALCTSFHSLQLSVYMDSLVKFFDID
jgi:hypothetical protein